MRLTAVLLTLVLGSLLQWENCQVGGQACDLTILPSDLWIAEGADNGTELLTMPGLNQAELVRFESPKPPPFIGLAPGTLYLNDTLDLDGRQDLCDDFINGGLQWKVFLRCQGQQDTHEIHINVNLTDDYIPEFTTSFTAKIQEMTLKDTQVNTIRSSQVRDRDCVSNLQLGVSTLFHIEGGNRDEAFTMSNPRIGDTVVNRLLDYENGDTHFVLNISISDRNKPDKKSYTTLEVTVLDVDDNDPVFNHSSYVLHVREEDTSSVDVWTSTEPPVVVRDPDVDVSPHGPLLIALYDPADSAIVEVNSSTGQVKMKKTFDREQQSSVSVVLKVQQTISSWRSSTATLTIVVDDVNDHPPLFNPHTYDVSVTEHSPPGTSVALVSATDADVGDNAVFSYTLENEQELFSLVSRRFGQQLYGALVIRNSSLLDRELTPQFNITIGTEEAAGDGNTLGQGGKGGGECSRGQCQARVTVTLLDINDNSPVFDAERYIIRVNKSTVPAAVVATVKATDADDGPNADLTYTLSEIGPKKCDYVIFDAVSGDVSFTGNGSVTHSEECTLIVTACDQPIDGQQQRCSTVPMEILMDMGDETVTLKAPVPSRVLLSDRGLLQREMGVVLGVTVTINYIWPDMDVLNRSIISIIARNPTSQEMLSRGELQRLVDDKAEAIAAIFKRYTVKTTTPNTNETDETDAVKQGLSPLLIALIAIVVALFLALILAVVFITKSRRRFKRQRRLIEKFTASISPIYDNADNPADQNGPRSTENHHVTDNASLRSREVNNSTSTVQNGSISSGRNHHAGNGRGDVQTARGTVPEGGVASRVTRNGVVRTIPETDSGVPSDREMGVGGESDPQSSLTVTPVMPRREASSSTGRYPNSFNDDLDGLARTQRHQHQHQRDNSTEEAAALPSTHHRTGRDDNDSPLPDPRAGVLLQPDRGDNGAYTYMNSHQDNGSTAVESGEGPHSTREAGLDQPVRPSHWQSTHTDSTPEDDGELSEEPEPDYAKKVRFGSHVSQPANNSGNGSSDSTGEEAGRSRAETVGSRGPSGHGTALGNSTEVYANIVPSYHNVEDEMTAL